MTGSPDLLTQAKLIAYAAKQRELFESFGIHIEQPEMEQFMEQTIVEGVRQFWVDHWKRQMEKTVGLVTDPERFDPNYHHEDEDR